MVVLPAIAALGLLGLALIKDFRGMRTWFVGSGDYPYETRVRHRYVLLFGWFAVMGSLYAVVGFGIRSIVDWIAPGGGRPAAVVASPPSERVKVTRCVTDATTGFPVAGLEVTNLRGERSGYAIFVDVVDGDGVRLVAFGQIPDLASGQAVRIEALGAAAASGSVRCSVARVIPRPPRE
ncbi:hypothetical protein [Streptomyces beijiangensis]|uniref:Uncharacterized protein n=2 Tax=Streptomyces beijiangensis TaxID=163361 RepID=A0A939JMM3_9ACTN|nr:hypothetical protein [Streptomyces beijiangensis]MBO0517595.1 hypothetical protein [Streptomyces beijiangensis]